MLDHSPSVVTKSLDAETAALLLEAASVVGRPLDGVLRYRLMARARLFAAGTDTAPAQDGAARARARGAD